MSRTGISWLVALAAVGALALMWWLRAPPRQPPAPALRSDYILFDYTLTALNEEGAESFTVSGPRLEREPAGKTLTLTTPRFSIPREDGQRWQATARSAWVSAKADEVRLLGEARLEGPPGRSGERALLSSERIELFPKRDFARSPVAVTVTQGGSILRGTGMEVDMRADRFRLLADVQARHAPQRRR
jgi:lipopolysaccharide export system protein LptC